MLFSLAIDLSRDFTTNKHLLDNRTIYTEQNLVLNFLFIFLYILQSVLQYPKYRNPAWNTSVLSNLIDNSILRPETKMSAAFLFSYPSFFVLFLYFIPVAEMKEKLKKYA